MKRDGDGDWSRLKTLFHGALGREPRDRRAWLDDRCAGAPALRARVESLLAAHDPDDDFMRPLPGGLVAGALGDPVPDRIGTRAGPWALEQVIARGGMGVVYLARRADDAYEKRVAVKIIHRHIVTPHLLRRFHVERQALASLDHPGICRLLDGGTTDDGLPYLAMEHIDGLPIDRHCDERRLTVTSRLELFQSACAAVQAAHRNLVVHRDLKPGNILVTRTAEVKLVDFGISRQLEQGGEQATLTSFRALTPEYASPEQLRGEPVTTATDVYSLGVVLYELLCGQRPHRLRDLPRYEADRVICEETPGPPSSRIWRHDQGTPGAPRGAAEARHETPRRLRRRLSGDLDNIVLMAMHKDPARRYASVEQLSDDLGRHLSGLPVRARRDAFGYRAAKFIRRHRARVAAAAIVALALTVALAAAVAGLVQARSASAVARSERNAALAAKSDAQKILSFYQEMLATTSPYRHGRQLTVVELLEEAAGRIDVDLADQPEVEAGVRLAIARSYVNLMLWPEAVPHLERALNLYRALRPPGDPALADCLSPLGRALTHMKVPRAVKLLEEGLAIRRAHYGPEHPLVAEITGNLGFALWSSGGPRRWRSAEGHYRQGLDMYERLGQGATPDVARLTMSLAFMLAHQGRDAEAEALYRKALALYGRMPVREDVYELATLSCFASLMERCGRLDEAAELLERFKAQSPEDYRPAQRQGICWRLGRLRSRLGEFDRAAREYRAALAFECRVLAARDDAARTRLEDLAEALQAEPRDGPQAPLIEAVLEALRPLYVERPVVLAQHASNLAGVLEGLGEIEAAARLRSEG